MARPSERTETARVADLHGAELHDASGDKIGTIDDVFVDEATGQPEWLRVKTGFMGMSHNLVPATGLRLDGEAYTVPYEKDTIKNAPDSDGEVITPDRERELVSHYELSHTERVARNREPAEGRPPVETDAELTRHEEELKVGRRDVAGGGVRLRRWVETEPVETEIELRRDEPVIEREQVDEPVSGEAIGEREERVDLRRDEPVVEKETRARERVHVGRKKETDTEQVSDEVRKERVEIEDERER